MQRPRGRKYGALEMLGGSQGDRLSHGPVVFRAVSPLPRHRGHWPEMGSGGHAESEVPLKHPSGDVGRGELGA